MKYVFILLFLLTFISCDKVGDIINNDEYQKPVIESLTLNPNILIIGDTLVAEVLATNPEEGELNYQWETIPEDKGTFIFPINESKISWIAPLSGGIYDIKVIVSNDQKSESKSEDVNVISLEQPLVNIIEPLENTYVVKGQIVNVVVSAFHENRLSFVRLYVANLLNEEKGYDRSNNYNFSFDTDTLAGAVTLRVDAEASNQLGNVGSDSIVINVEGILPKPGRH